MIWLDIIDPKYVLFFRQMLPLLKTIDEILITTRKSQGYDECARLLELFGIEAYCVGGYGGASKEGKFQARLDRQKAFLELFSNFKQMPRLFITGASVEGVQSAFGLGIPVVNFADTPVANDHFSLDCITILSRLTLPLSTLVFRPFVVPEICYTSLGLDPCNVKAYDFIDVALWLKDIPESTPDSRKIFCDKLGLDEKLPIILVREEEYKAHYVKEKLPVIEQSIALLAQNLNVNILIMPRYESDYLIKQFSLLQNVVIWEEKIEPKVFYPHIDLLIGGGGTMNLEACYLGIPVISTRSLFLFHDRYLLNNGLMKHCKSADEVLESARIILRQNTPKILQKKLFEPKTAGFETIIQDILPLIS